MRQRKRKSQPRRVHAFERLEPREMMANDVYSTSGTPGQQTAVRFDFMARDKGLSGEFGLFKVDDAAGAIGGVLPGDPSYARLALAHVQTIFKSTQAPGAALTASLINGQQYGLYLLPKSSVAAWNRAAAAKKPDVFFSFDAANPGGFDQLLTTVGGDTTSRFNFESTRLGGDGDYNDYVFQATVKSRQAIQVIGTPGQSVPTTFTLDGRNAAYSNELGYFVVDNAAGRIGNLLPGDKGYAKAAMSRFTTIFGSLEYAGTEHTVNLPGGGFIGLYLIRNGTRDQLLRKNSNNTAGGKPEAIFSFPDANNDKMALLQWLSAGKIGFEDGKKGGDRDFNDLTASFTYGAAPTLAMGLLHDTAPGGATNSDLVTFDPTISGHVDSTAAVTRLEARLSGGATAFFDVTSSVGAGNNFTFDTARLSQIFGSALPDGQRTLEVRATNSTGQTSATASFTFTLDRIAPNLALDLDPAFDTDPVGDQHTMEHVVTLVGATEPNLSVRLDGVATPVQAGGAGAFSFAGVNLADGANGFTVRAFDAAGNEGTFTQTITLDSCPLSPGPTWAEAQQGGSETGQGQVVWDDCTAELIEGDSFLVTLTKTLTVPAVPSILKFTFAGPSFDTTADSVNDAFEAALVDDQGNPLVLPIAGSRDAFFNMTEGVTPTVSAQAMIDGSTVEVDLSRLAPGSTAKLIFRLVNNDGDTRTSVVLNDLSVETGDLNTPAGVAFASALTAQTVAAADFARLTDITSDVGLVYGTTSLHEGNTVLFTDVALINQGNAADRGPLVAVIDSLSDPSVAVRNPDGFTPSGLPYFNYGSSISGGTLAPGATTAARTLQFVDPSGIQFTFHASIYSLADSPPTVARIPTLEGVVGQPFSYQIEATDADGDDLSYSLPGGPPGMPGMPGMTIDQSGRISWTPTSDDVGAQQVRVRVEDGRGGYDEEAFTLVVRDAVPNRPPIITSSPVTDAAVAVSFQISDLAVGRGPVGLAVGDFTGDGNRVVTANQANQSVSLAGYTTAALAAQNPSTTILGEPPPRTDQLFEQGYVVDTGMAFNRNQNTNAITSGDFNGDGITDIAVTMHSEQFPTYQEAVSVMLGIGDGTYQPAKIVYQVISGDNTNPLTGILSRDFDQDGQMDLVVGENSAKNLMFLKGHGDGTFDATPLRTATNFHPQYLRTDDFNHDGQLDIAEVGTSPVPGRGDDWQTEVLFGNGDGTFQTAVDYVNVPAGESGRYIADIQIGDLDGKNGPDLVIGDWDNDTMEVWLNDGNGAFSPPIGQRTGLGTAGFISLGDFDADGMLDAVACGPFGNQAFFKGNGDGTLVPPASSSPAITRVGANFSHAYADSGNTAIDLNGDGKLDVYAAERTKNVLTVGLGRGDGTFDYTLMFAQSQPDDPTIRAFGAGFASPLAIDANHDGVYDMAVASYTPFNSGAPGQLGIILGDEPGSFRTPQLVPGQSNANAFADLNNDGQPDLVMLRNPLWTSLGNPDGSFPDPVRADGSNIGTYDRVVTADFNGDGNQDVVYETGDRTAVNLGVGDGTFQGPIILDGGLFGGTQFAAPDLTGDGHPDVIASSTIIQVYATSVNNGAASFARLSDVNGRLPPYRNEGWGVAAADFDGDGITDLVTTALGTPNQFLFFKGHQVTNPTDVSDLFDAPVVTTPGMEPIYQMIPADFNHDGNQDLVLMSRFQVFYVMLNTGHGDGSFAPPTRYTSGEGYLTVGDFDGDGNLDIGLGNGHDFPSVRLGLGNGTFGGTIYLPSQGAAYSVDAADLNGDGKSDFVTLTGNANVQSFPSSNVFLSRLPGIQAVATGDLDGDGNLDAIVADFGMSHLTPLYGDGQGNLTRQNDLIVARGPIAVTMSDLNDDHHDDIVSVNRSSNSISVLIGSAGGQFARTDLTTGSRPVAVAVKDVLGDSGADLVVANGGETSLSLFQNLGSGQFAAGVLLPIGIHPTQVSLADVNGDGRADIIAASESDRAYVIALNQGGGVFVVQTPIPTAASVGGLAVGDLNGDGHDDLVITNPAEHQVSLYLGLGAGQFATPQPIRFDHSPTAVKLADMNGDGQLDIVTTNSDSDTATVIISRFNPAATYRYQVTASDPDGDAVTFDLLSGPAGMSIDSATGQITWVATPDQVGTHPVVVRASDGRGGFATQQYNVEVSADNGNSPPRFVTTPVASVLSTSDYHYAARAADADQDPVRYAIVSGPDGLTIDANSGDLSWGEPVGRGLTFNGIGDEVVVGAPPSLAFDRQATISVWVKFDQTPTEAGHNMFLAGTEQSGDLLLEALNYGGLNRFMFDVYGRTALSNTLLQDGQWYHVTGTFVQGDKMQLFINGVLDSEVTTADFTTDRHNEAFLTFGNSPLSNRAVGLAGSLDSVRIFNTALTPQQAADEYRRAGANAPGLLGDWELNELDGPLAIDASGLGNNGTLSAAYAGRSMRTTFADRVTPGGRSGDYPVVLRVTDGRGGADEQPFTLHVAGEDPAVILGAVFNDQNGDGQMTGDARLAGWTLYLDEDNNNTHEPWEPTTTTDAGGNYSFGNLTAGTYHVAVLGQPGYKPTVPATASTSVTLAASQNPAGVEYASSVIDVSSQYNNTTGPWSASQALGPPNTTAYGDMPTSWTTAGSEMGIQSITVGFDTAAIANAVTIRETFNNGFVTQIDAIDTNNGVHTVWTGADTSVSYTPFNFTASFAPTTYLVKAVKVYIDTNHINGYEEVDSIQLHTLDISQFHDFGEQADAAGDRGPAFASAPITAAQVDDLYTYQPQVRNLDGRPLMFDVLVAPAGFAMNADTGGIAWLPTADESGNHRVLIRVTDDRGLVDIQDFTISVAAAPTAPFITSTPPAQALVGLPYRYAPRVQDAEGGPFTFDLAAPPPAGLAIDHQTGVISWIPAAGQEGHYDFGLIVTDPTGLTARQDFAIDVATAAANHDPHIDSSPRTAAGLARAYRYQVLAADVDGDPLQYSVTGPAGMTIDADGLVRWTPADLGSFPVTIQISDGRGGIAAQSFQIDVVSQLPNSAPRFTSAPPTTAAAGATFAYQAQIVDPDQDPVTFVLDQAPAGLSLDPQTGLLLWQTASATRGDFPITIRAIDPYGAEATQSFTLSVRSANAPPAITSIPPTEAFQGVAYTYSVAAADPFGRPLTYSLVSFPAGMTIDAASGVITWTPTDLQLGLQSVSIQVTNDHGGAALQAYDIVVTDGTPNLPPVINSVAPVQATVGVEYQYAVQAADPEGLALHYELRAFPAGMTIDAAGVIHWTPADPDVGTHPVTVAALDPAGKAALQSFLLAALPPNHDPTINSAAPAKPISGGALFRYTVAATDQDHDVLTYTLTQSPAGMTIDAFGHIIWQTVQADHGPHPVSVSVNDGRGGLVTQDFTINVDDDATPPRVSIVPATNLVYFASSAVIHVSAADDVGIAALSLTMNGQPVPLDNHGIAVVPYPSDGHTHVVTFTATAVDPAGNVTHASTTVKFFNSADVTTPPQVGILSPADTGVVTGPTDVIGTIADGNLREWHLLVKPADATDDFFTELGSGTTPLNDAVLGHFDPTRLQNGSYVLRLDATDESGNETFTDNRIGVSGDLKLGNFQLAFTDLTIPVSGIPITVSRTYDSLAAGDRGDFGFGWKLNFRDANLRTGLVKTGLEDFGIYSAFQPGTKVYLTLPGGQREGFTFTPDIRTLFELTAVTPRFTPDPGVTDTLSVRGGTFLLGDDGAIYSGDGQPYNPAAEEFGGGYTLTTKDGVVFRIDGNTGLVNTLTDPAGNTLTFTDRGIASSTGAEVTFQRDARGRIVAVTDPSGQSVRYTYSPAGDLATVTDRIGNVTQLSYDPAHPHYLSKIVDPLGRTGIRSEYDASGRLTRTIDANGKAITIDYDPNNSLVTTTDALGNPTTLEYDNRGNIVQVTDALGGVTSYTYDVNNHRLTITDALGRTQAFAYDGAGNIVTKTDALGNVSRYTYGIFNRQLSVTDPLGNTISAVYDSHGTLVSRTEADGSTTSLAVDSQGQVSSVTNALGQSIQVLHGGAGNVDSLVNAQGNATDYAYDANGKLLSQAMVVTAAGGPRTVAVSHTYDADGRVLTTTNPDGGVIRATYDAAGNVASMTDTLGRRTQYTYDALNRLIKTTYEDGTSTQSTYDAAGHQLTATDRAGRVTQYIYDALGRLLRTTHPDTSFIQYEYDAAGDLITQTDERGHATHYAYDVAGREISATDALGNVTTYAYDAAGRVVAETDPLLHTTHYAYDARGHVALTTFADGSTVQAEYDAVGRKVAETDPMGATTRYQYDALNQLTAVIDPLGNQTLYAYDEIGNRISQTDANGHLTRFEYDVMGRMTAEVLPLGQRPTTAYDLAGNVTQTTDANGQTTTYTYDTNNRLLTQNLPGGSSVVTTYTASGQRASVTQVTGATSLVTTYQYDTADRLLSVHEPDGQTITYTYDAAGNETSVSTTGVGTTLYTYDALNRLQSVQDAQGHVTQYQYDAAGNLLHTTLPNGVVEDRDYDALHRLVSIVANGPGGLVSSETYTLRADGKIAALDELGPSGHLQYAFSYDADGRLTGESIAGLAATPRTFAWTFDAVGNRLTQSDSSTGLTTYTYDADDRLVQETQGAATTTFAYDANGNQLTSFTSAAQHSSYQWDSLNHLVRADVTQGGVLTTTTYAYDADGNLVARTSGGTVTRYLVDANTNYSHVLKEYTTLGVMLVGYVYGSSLISEVRSGAVSYYLGDATGSTRVLTSAAGTTLNRYAYDALGNVLAQSELVTNTRQYLGEPYDASTGLTYLRARWLDSSTSRFISQDPAAGNAQSPISLNHYAYANADPLNLTDPSGKATLVEALVTIAITTIMSAAVAYDVAGGTTYYYTGDLDASLGTAETAGTEAGASALIASTAAEVFVAGVSYSFGAFIAPVGRGIIGWVTRTLGETFLKTAMEELVLEGVGSAVATAQLVLGKAAAREFAVDAGVVAGRVSKAVVQAVETELKTYKQPFFSLGRDYLGYLLRKQAGLIRATLIPGSPGLGGPLGGLVSFSPGNLRAVATGIDAAADLLAKL